MMNRYPYPEFQARRSIVAGILLSLVTLGIYGLYWQYKQMATLDAWLGRNEFSFWLWFFLSIITCGIFGIYYEYKMATGINEVQDDNDLTYDSNLPVICVLVAIFGFWIASVAIQQHQINRLYERNSNG
ncbi:MAG: DUF4234 domain-containing protein [Gemmatimonadota bacterium]|nr:DUF4234 domain-containing protein [Gemmatimonadota bacterium]